MNDIWIFAYGSLLWDSGFVPAEVRPARLMGYERSFCMQSLHFRGTAEAPGLVLALEPSPNAYCDGLALLLPRENRDAHLATLRARELISMAYDECLLPLQTPQGPVDAIAYVMNRASPQYCNHSLEEQARIIAHAQGSRGPNRDYLFNTLQQLDALGITDEPLCALGKAVAQSAP